MLTATTQQIKIARGHGPEYSPIMIVGDYSNADDLKNEKALSGSIGEMVNSLLRKNKHSIDKCYRTNYVKCQLTGYGTKNKKKAKEILDAAFLEDDWNARLIEEINFIKPNIILSLGELALNFLTGERGIHKFRGSILPLRKDLIPGNTINVVAAIHPRDIFVDRTIFVYTALDYAKVIKHQNLKENFTEKGLLWIARSFDALSEYWKRAKSGKFLTLDIETRFNYPTCIGFCADGNEAVSVPLLYSDLNNNERLCIFRLIDEILRSPIPKVNQNMKFDWTMLERIGFQLKHIVGDTMLAAHTIYPELPKGLDFLTSIYTESSYYKDEGKEFDPKLHSVDQLYFYNAKDALNTWNIWEAQKQDLEDLKLTNFYFNFIQPLFFHYKKVDDRGIRYDEAKRLDLLDKYYNLLEEHTSNLEKVYGQSLNVRSPKQIGVFVYEFLECKLHTHKTPAGNEVYSTNEDALTEIYLNEESDETKQYLLMEIIFCRKIEKVLQLLESLPCADGRYRTSYRLEKVDTGRTSTSKAVGQYLSWDREKRKIKGNCELGMPFQMISKHEYNFGDEAFVKDIREMFVPSPGYSFFAADGANAEGRVVCVLAQDWDALEYMAKGGNLHKLTASWIYDWPVEKIDKTSEKYAIGKMARHAGNLGQGGHGLSIKVHKPTKFCNQVMAKFHKMAPNVQGVFQMGVEKCLKDTGKLISPSGRRRDFFGLTRYNEKDIFKKAYSFLPQSTVSDNTKLRSLEIAELAPWAFQVFEAHDGLMWEVPNDKIEEFGTIASASLSKPINFSQGSLPRDYNLVIPVEMEVGRENWYHMVEFKL